MPNCWGHGFHQRGNFFFYFLTLLVVYCEDGKLTSEALTLLIVNAEAYLLFTVKSNLTFWMYCWTSIYLDSGELSNHLVQNLISKLVHSSQNIWHFVHCLTTILNVAIIRRLSVLSFLFIKLWSNWTIKSGWFLERNLWGLYSVVRNSYLFIFTLCSGSCSICQGQSICPCGVRWENFCTWAGRTSF
jgi:hypothetical protein